MSVIQVNHPPAGALEKTLFSGRRFILLLLIMATVFLANQAIQIKPDASFEKMIPLQHPYIQKMLEHRDDLNSGANSIRIAVFAKNGDIFSKEYIDTLQQVNDEVFFIPGVNRIALKSLWTPNTRWIAVSEDGFDGGQVIPPAYDGSEQSLESIRQNIMRSGEVGRIVANNFRSSIIVAPLLDINPETGKPIDYQELSAQLEQRIRTKYQNENIDIHIIGFAKKVGDLLDGIGAIGIFALITFFITALLLYIYSRCLRSTLVPLLCSVVAVIWQLGILRFFGFGLDAYSVLVPFLVFAIGVSHGVQLINAIAFEAAKGSNKVLAAQIAFRNLYLAGIIALVSDAVGFLTLLIIDIQVIQELAIAASLGVAVIILTNLVLLPLLMSYIGVSKSCIRHAQQKLNKPAKHWDAIARFTTPAYAKKALAVAAVLFMVGFYFMQDLKIGDLDKGAPELRADSAYNLDNNFIVENYSTSSDVMVVMVETTEQTCVDYPAMSAIDRFEWQMKKVPGVQSTISIASITKQVTVGMNEGNLKLFNLPRDQTAINTAVNSPNMPVGLYNTDCSLIPVMIFLTDHKAETLNRVVAEISLFAEQNNTANLRFQLAAGNAGIEAATNQDIEKAQNLMLILVYAVVSILVFATFRSIQTVICIIVPLALTSVLCQMLMAYLGIGVKVATLPVIALGVGIGVDYGIYIFSRLRSYLILGVPLRQAYLDTLKTTGKAVAFTGVTLAIGVATWTLSPIKFQADMGILLTFMFLLNMLGALCLLPALAYVLIKPQTSEQPVNDVVEKSDSSCSELEVKESSNVVNKLVPESI